MIINYLGLADAGNLWDCDPKGFMSKYDLKSLPLQDFILPFMLYILLKCLTALEISLSYLIITCKGDIK